MSSDLQLDVRCLSWCGGDIWWTLMKERQAWCYLQVKLCDPYLSALSVRPWPKKCYINTLPVLFLFLYIGTLEVSSNLLVVGAKHWQLGDDRAWNVNVPCGQRIGAVLFLWYWKLDGSRYSLPERNVSDVWPCVKGIQSPSKSNWDG